MVFTTQNKDLLDFARHGAKGTPKRHFALKRQKEITMAKKLMVLEEGFARKATVVEVDVLEDSEVLLRILASRQRLDGIMDDIVDCRFGDLVLAALIAAEDRAAKLAKEKALKREAEAAQEAA